MQYMVELWYGQFIDYGTGRDVSNSPAVRNHPVHDSGYLMLTQMASEGLPDIMVSSC